MAGRSGAAMSARYEPASVEPAIYERWLASGAFTPAADAPPGAARFVIIQPPPNVTGALHLGHALTATVEDAFVRHHRMLGDDTLWLPGVDHASIAAQFVLDRILADEGESRASLGRERYLDRMWRFMDETRGIIGNQHQRLGASLDWTRLRFTMDDFSARAVRVAFKRLWDAGLVYRGEALVNWCPRCRTTISDLENIHSDQTGTLWTVRYHLVAPDGTPEPDGWISVATTRPETILGDTAVAVHPDDERYRKLVGREVILPFGNRRVPIVADAAVEQGFGTGAVKITPAHDFDDYELGKRHGLPMLGMLDEEARMVPETGEFAGLDRFDARERVVERLREMGDLVGEVSHEMVIGRCDRCGTIVEPRLSVQWFIRVKPLADRALASIRDGRTRIIPGHFEKVFAHWMENIHDWAVGRQLWWGHRIPAWYCPDGHLTVTDAEEGPSACAECGRPSDELRQETDIFDTWFSSGLWPFSTLGWPDDSPDLRRFYPTSVMETAYEILFFWVARMMMLGLFLTEVEPFHTVYLHGIVRDPYGQKMSKTKGNVVDPLEMVSEIGADALRLALVSGNAPGVDQRLTQARLTGARNFTNKLWNAARWVVANQPQPWVEPASATASLAQDWIRSRLAGSVARASRQLDELDLAGYVVTVHDAVWSDYCDAYLEMAKIELRRDDATGAQRCATWRTAVDVLRDLLRLLHPIAPFVTEEIWRSIRTIDPGRPVLEELLVTAHWPVAGDVDEVIERDGGDLLALVRDLRDQRQSLGVAPGAWAEATIISGSPGAADLLERARPYVVGLARLRSLDVRRPGDGSTPPANASSTRLGTSWLALVPEAGAAAARRDRRAAELGIQVERLRHLLANESFVERAPAEVVERERARLAELEAQVDGLRADGED